MSRNSLLAILSVAIFAAVSFFFWYNVAPTNKDQLQPPALAPLATASNSAEAATDTLQEFAQVETYFNGSWTLATSSESFVGYRLTQELEDQEVVGRTTQLSGAATIKNDQVQEAQFSAPVSLMVTGDKDFDTIFANEMVQAEMFPNAILVITSMQLPANAKRAEGLPATGTLTLRDITQEVAFTVDTQISEDGTIELVAIIDLLLSDYKISQPADPLLRHSEDSQLEARLFLKKT